MSELDAVAEAKAALEGVTPGPWEVQYEACDCGNGYPCHGAYVYAINGPVNHLVINDKNFGADYVRDYGHEITEVVALSETDAEFIAAARTLMPALIDRCEALTRPTVSTVEQLDALPERSVIRDRGGRVFEKTDDWRCAGKGFSSWWSETGAEGESSSDELDDLPAVVLWQPGRDGR